jgi:Abnormal spindle-like microcephaly-assoc'd, ASPM-SPD-2-Hydin
MKHHHPILEGAYARDFFHLAAKRTTTVVRNFPVLLVIFGLVVMSGCVGLTGKPGLIPSIAMEVKPNPLDFGTVMVGSISTQTVTVVNTGAAKFTLTKISASGPGFTISGLSAPKILAAGQSIKLTVVFRPTSAAQESGNFLVAINTQDPQIVGSLKGTGSTSLLSVTPSVVGFGNVSVGSPVSQSLRLTNSGSASVAIKSASITGTGFSISGLTTPRTLTPGESVNFTAEFNPKSAGTEAGTISIETEGTRVVIQLSGVGAQKGQQPSVTLNWDESTSQVVGYFVYRSSKPSGPYTKLNPKASSETSYIDSSVASGQMYFYVVTSVNSENIESAFSERVSVTVPSS